MSSLQATSRASLLALIGLLALPTQAARPRAYSLSVEAIYGHETSRQAYLEEIQRHLLTWVATSGDLEAPTDRTETDLHLQVVIDEIERGRGYANVSGERDIFADTGTIAISPYLYRTRLEVRAVLIDLHRDAFVLFEETFTIYTEIQETKVAPDPRQRSWNDSLEFLIGRLQRLLSKRGKKIRTYMEEHPAPAH